MNHGIDNLGTVSVAFTVSLKSPRVPEPSKMLLDPPPPRNPKVCSGRQLAGKGAGILQGQVNGARADDAGIDSFVPVPLGPGD